jgi:hypothetical protein
MFQSKNKEINTNMTFSYSQKFKTTNIVTTTTTKKYFLMIGCFTVTFRYSIVQQKFNATHLRAETHLKIPF